MDDGVLILFCPIIYPFPFWRGLALFSWVVGGTISPLG